MKKLFLFVSVLFIGYCSVSAKEDFRYDQTVWNVIRSRFFNGENSRVFRYEEDIRIQMKGEPRPKDSLIVKQMISELDSLIETVEIKLVNENPNFIIEFMQNSNTQFSTSYKNKKSKITFSEIKINADSTSNNVFVQEYLYWLVIRSILLPKYSHKGIANYGGIYDLTLNLGKTEFTEIDKQIIRKVYSKDFYKQLKSNTIKRQGYLAYLNLRYSKALKYYSVLLGILFSVLGFYVLFVKAYSKGKGISIKEFLKSGLIISILVYIIYACLTLSSNVFIGNNLQTLGFIAKNLIMTILIGLISALITFFSEKIIFKINLTFLKRQFFIFLSTFLSLLISWYLFFYFFDFLNEIYKSYWLRMPNVEVTYLLIFSILISALRVFINFTIQTLANQKDVEIARLKELKNQAELQTLHSRINPHFLYNALNSIAGLAYTDAGRTSKMAVSLSELFRYSINKESKTFVTVAEELEMAEKYLEVEKERFTDRLDYSIEASEDALKLHIPKFAIQPLVENAIKHGIAKVKTKGIIKIEIKNEINTLTISVYDNGPDFPDSLVGGYGLQNLHEILHILYSGKASILWENGENKNIKITLPENIEVK